MAERKLKLNTKQAVSVETPRAALSSEEVVESEVGVDNVLDEEISNLIDDATEWDIEQKRLKKLVDNAKALLKEHAIQNKWKSRSGEVATCNIGRSSKTDPINVTEFAKLLKAEGKLHLFNELTSVRIGDSKKYLGEDAMSDLIHVTNVEYGTVGLKPMRATKKK